MEWSTWNWINVACVFFSGHIAIGCWKKGNNIGGHLNAFAAVLNGVIVATRLGL